MSRNKVGAPPGVPDRLGWSQTQLGDVLIAGPAGELDLSTADDLDRWLRGLVESGTAASVVVDFTNVRFVDCHSIGLIIAARAVAEARGVTLLVDGLCGLSARLFDLLGLGYMRVSRPSIEGASGGDRGDRRQLAGGTARRWASAGRAHDPR